MSSSCMSSSVCTLHTSPTVLKPAAASLPCSTASIGRADNSRLAKKDFELMATQKCHKMQRCIAMSSPTKAASTLRSQNHMRKKEAREVHKRSEFAQKVHGIRAKLYQKKRFKEKATMRKTIAMHQERGNKHANEDAIPDGAVPAYLLDREGVSRAKVLSNTVKQKRKEKAGKWDVPIPKVKPVADDEMFKVLKSGQRRNKAWKRMVTKVTFVGDGFTRKAPKYERFIRPSGLRMKKAHVTHPELKATFHLDIIGVKKNPSSPLYTQLGVITKGTVIEVNVSDLGLVTTSGKVVWANASASSEAVQHSDAEQCCGLTAGSSAMMLNSYGCTIGIVVAAAVAEVAQQK
eukprot:10511-Heterococcus_DN1.PRE.3